MTEESTNATPNGERIKDTAPRLYVVTLVDLLGQKTMLNKWACSPSSPQESVEFDRAIQDTFERVKFWRTEFNRFFEQAKTHVSLRPDEFPNTCDGESLSKFATMGMESAHFSDTIIMYSPLLNEYGHLHAGTVFAHLFTCGALHLTALELKTPLRGAVEVGMAIEDPEIGLYGPVLAAAHHLESERALSPRIMVGDRLRQYLCHSAHPSWDISQTTIDRHATHRAHQLIGQDWDGEWILDYLAPAAKRLGFDTHKWDGWCEAARSFVHKELARFEAEGNQKLARRYHMLANYFQSRLGPAPTEKGDAK